MKVYIGSCGVGLGHVTRSEAIARELTCLGCDVLFSSYLDGLSYLNRTGWKHNVSPPISFRTGEDGTIDTKLTATQNGVTVGLWKFVKQLVSEIRGIIRYNPDIVVSDTRLSTLLAGFVLKRPTLLVINQYSVQMPRHADSAGFIDKIMLAYARLAWKYASTMLDLCWGLSSVIAIPDLDRPLTISTYNLSIPKRVSRKVRLVGPLSPSELLKRHNRDKAAHEQPRIFACISGPANDRQHLVKLLLELLKPLSAEYDITMSCGNPKGSSRPTWNNGITVYEWMERIDYERNFREADLIISRAGHSTLMMGVTLGKPLILIPPPNHTEQANNARRAQELGLAVVLKQANLNTNVLEMTIENSLARTEEGPFTIRAAIKAQDGIRALTDLVCALGRETHLANPALPPEQVPTVIAT